MKRGCRVGMGVLALVVVLSGCAASPVFCMHTPPLLVTDCDVRRLWNSNEEVVSREALRIAVWGNETQLRELLRWLGQSPDRWHHLNTDITRDSSAHQLIQNIGARREDFVPDALFGLVRDMHFVCEDEYRLCDTFLRAIAGVPPMSNARARALLRYHEMYNSTAVLGLFVRDGGSVATEALQKALHP